MFQVKVRNLIWLNLFYGMQNTDLFIPERLIESAETQSANGFPISLSHGIRTQDQKSPTACTNRGASLELYVHGQTLGIPNRGVRWGKLVVNETWHRKEAQGRMPARKMRSE